MVLDLPWSLRLEAPMTCKFLETPPCPLVSPLQTEELAVFVDFTAPRVSTTGLPPLDQAQPSRVTFNLAEASQLPTGSYSPIATYQTLVEVCVCVCV